MTKHFFRKKLIFNYIFNIIIFIFLYSYIVLAKESFYDLEKKCYESMGEIYNSNYNVFLTKIGNEDYTNVFEGWTRFRPQNDNLIIGSSAVVHCGYTLGDTIDTYGYDIVGYGGICDNKLKELLPFINKKYNKIILFEGVNTANILALNNIEQMTKESYDSILSTIAFFKNKLLKSNGEIIYVKVKHMTFDRDSKDMKYIKRYNKIANQINECLDALGIKTYEIPFETTTNNTINYVHFNNIAVWEDMLNK